MPADKLTAIIIVNWNRYQLTADCIRSLEAVKEGSFDVIVVDNGSEDDSARLLEEHFPGIFVIKSGENLGFSGGNNLGLRYAIAHGYRYAMLLNNDTFVKDDFFVPLVNYMESSPDTGIIQPLIYFHHDRALVWNGGSYFNPWFSNTISTNYNRPLKESSTRIKEVDWVTGCAFFLRLSVLAETGLLAENMFAYYEDVDLSFRIKKAGYRLLYHPGSVIYHIAGMSGKNAEKGKEGCLTPLTHYLNLRNRIWLVKKYTRPQYIITAFAFNFLYIVSVMGYFVVRLRLSKFRAVLKAVRDGIKGQINYQ